MHSCDENICYNVVAHFMSISPMSPSRSYVLWNFKIKSKILNVLDFRTPTHTVQCNPPVFSRETQHRNSSKNAPNVTFRGRAVAVTAVLGLNEASRPLK